jgi:phage/conjugal plasmid C-4 type zinc finger TraR family protein
MIFQNRALAQGLAAEQVAQFQQRLDTEAARLRGLAAILKADGTGGELSTASDGATTSEDIAEASTTREQYAVLVAHVEQAMRDITAAQARIAAGRYGLCVDCGTPIPLARLEALPVAGRCVACQQRWQQSHYHHHGR